MSERYEVRYDIDMPVPLEDHEVEFFLVDCGYTSTLEDYNHSDVEYWNTYFDSSLPTKKLRGKALERAMRLAGMEFKRYKVIGHSQGEIWEYLLISEDGDMDFLDMVAQEMKSWLLGNVYYVTDTETGVSLWGIFAEEIYDAVKNWRFSNELFR